MNEGQSPMGKTRLEAFFDGVVAIIITIMVLEMKVPHGDSLASLAPLLPVLLSYVLSFIYLGIYWNNHHHMMHAGTRATGSMLWANLHLLFWLSLIPFTTGWMGETTSQRCRQPRTGSCCSWRQSRTGYFSSGSSPRRVRALFSRERLAATGKASSLRCYTSLLSGWRSYRPGFLSPSTSSSRSCGWFPTNESNRHSCRGKHNQPLQARRAPLKGTVMPLRVL